MTYRRMDYSISKIWAKGFTEKRELNEEFYLFIFKIIHKYITQNNNHNWLDVGCGDGRILIPLAIKFPNIKFYGVDINRTMIRNLNKIIKRNKIKNVIAKRQSIEDFIKNKKSFGTISFFQSIHFFHTQKILKGIYRRLKKDGYIIITTTTHQQFKSIPYSKDARVYQIEKKRTPDWIDIVHELKRRNIRLITERNFTISRTFKDIEALRSYLNTIPYSAFTLTSPSDRFAIIKNIVKRYNSRKNFKFIIDKFKVGIFKSYE